jgi:hypothetical protein
MSSLYTKNGRPLQLLEQGLRVLIGKSKRDPEGTGRFIDIPYAPPEVAWLCPVRNTLTWLDATGRRQHLHRTGQPRAGTVPLLSGLTRGAAVRPTALSPAVVADIVKATASNARTARRDRRRSWRARRGRSCARRPGPPASGTSAGTLPSSTFHRGVQVAPHSVGRWRR